MDRIASFMREAGCSAGEIARFGRAIAQLERPTAGWLPECELEPVAGVEQLDRLPWPSAIHELLAQVVVIKLNGGLGTSMGLRGPKSLLRVKPDHTFLSLTVEQLRHQQARHGLEIPLLLLNSFTTVEPTGRALGELGFRQEMDWDLRQGKVPKLLAEGHDVVVWPQAPELAWCPPGHGEIYAVLRESGRLRELLDRGIRYAFVSNIDNTGAVLDERILAWFALGGFPLAMEVTRRTPADRKGGHLARRQGRWVLREVAQCLPQDRAAFEDIERHGYFNTNNVWLNLEALAKAGDFELPLIVNRKSLDPRDPASPPVLQLESALGAAIGVLAGSCPLEVPRSRFAPVKNLADLLVVRSLAYAVDEQARLQLVAPVVPQVWLGPDYRTVEDLEQCFPVALDLRETLALRIEGRLECPQGLLVRGEVRLRGGPVRLQGCLEIG